MIWNNGLINYQASMWGLSHGSAHQGRVPYRIRYQTVTAIPDVIHDDPHQVAKMITQLTSYSSANNSKFVGLQCHVWFRSDTQPASLPRVLAQARASGPPTSSDRLQSASMPLPRDKFIAPAYLQRKYPPRLCNRYRVEVCPVSIPTGGPYPFLLLCVVTSV